MQVCVCVAGKAGHCHQASLPPHPHAHNVAKMFYSAAGDRKGRWGFLLLLLHKGEEGQFLKLFGRRGKEW